jgi:prepilin-type N-terminal cleavage/methylation domain-containing protein
VTCCGPAPTRAGRAGRPAGSSVDLIRDRGHRTRLRASGFTLIEVLITTALLGILATLGLLTAQQVTQRAKATATATQMAFIRTGLLNLATNCEGLPLSVSGGGDPGLAYKPTGSTCWNGPYLVRWPTKTPFGSSTTYRYQATKGAMATISAQSLASADATALGAVVGPMFSNSAKLTKSSSVWTVTVNVGNFYK